MGYINYKKIYAMKKQSQETLIKVNNKIDNNSGIYILTRIDENGIPFCYIGQAKHLIDRMSSHLTGYSQRIDLSLRKRGFKKLGKENGWELEIVHCLESELDAEEQKYIKMYIEKGYQMYNRTLGSQSEGKVGINDTSTKGYLDGIRYGYSKAIKEIKIYFDKYLNYSIKPELVKKNGEFTETAKRKFNEFGEMLKGEKTDAESESIEM